MPNYRIFILDSETGQRRPGDWLDADDHDEAINLARQLAQGQRCEVWLKSELVAIVSRDAGTN